MGITDEEAGASQFGGVGGGGGETLIPRREKRTVSNLLEL